LKYKSPSPSPSILHVHFHRSFFLEIFPSYRRRISKLRDM
jgi:hypothetical protein